jgi:endonuclease/exonuclease/phosphatase family metal-dependent hydrolase
MSRLRKAAAALLVLLLFTFAALLARYFVLGVEITEEQAKLPPPPAEPAATEFSIVTYNVQARPYFDDSVHKFERMPKVLNPFDIVSFQECFKDHGRLWRGLTHPVKVYHASIKTPFKIVGSGLGTVARFPLTGVESMHFTTAGDFQNKPASKGMLLTRFSVGGMPLDVYTTHMEAGKPEPAMVSRRKQAEEIVAFVRKHSQPESAVIVHGDFNMRHSEPGQEDPKIAAGNPPERFTGLSRNHIFDSLNAALKLKDLAKETVGKYLDAPDHILFRSGTKAVLTPLSWQHDAPEFYDEAKQPLSDHEPVIGRFRIAPPAP